MSDKRPPSDQDTYPSRPPMVSKRPPEERIPGRQGEQQPPPQRQADFPQRQPGQADPTRAYEAPKTRGTKRPPAPPPPAESGLAVPWWGFVLVILAVAGITCGLWGLVLMNRGEAPAGMIVTPTPIFVVITSTPTLGPAPGEATAVPTTIPTQSGGGSASTPDLSVGTPIPAERPPVTIGSTVRVSGTEGVGLAVRQGPGRDFTYFFVAQDGDMFVVQDGPRESDEIIWWEIEDPNDPNRTGWVSGEYIEVVDP